MATQFRLGNTYGARVAHLPGGELPLNDPTGNGFLVYSQNPGKLIYGVVLFFFHCLAHPYANQNDVSE